MGPQRRRGASAEETAAADQLDFLPAPPPAPKPPSRKRAAPPPEGTRLAALVAPALPIGPLSYAVPPALEADAALGALVKVSLRGRDEIGCVVALEPIADALARTPRLLPIGGVASPGFRVPEEVVELGRWMADYYVCSLGEALACASFIGFRDLETAKRLKGWRVATWWRESPENKLEDALADLTKRQRETFRWLAANAPAEGLPATALRGALGVTDGVLKKLSAAKLLEEATLEVEPAFEPPAPSSPIVPSVALPLFPGQAKAFAKIAERIDEKKFGSFLLKGVTGSGKTEIYLQALERTLAQGRAGVALVPEISLTPQTVARFQARFGAERVGVYHSRQTPLDKLRLARAIESGRVDVVIGARSALFAPFPRLGLIVVDEEHESSYKQDSTPRYHARDVALMRASRCGAVVILGSATPSVESTWNAENGKHVALRLDDRANESALPKVEIVDMGTAAKEGRVVGAFSRRLLGAMAETLAASHQVLLLLNRRGFHAFFFCHHCRAPVSCPHCDLALTHHRAMNALMCHVCGHRQPARDACPTCGGEATRTGMGTERLEEELAGLFPNKRALRLDQDTTGGRHDFESKWKSMETGDVDIILGTQMIAKGLHLERVSLVGVVLADISLHQPDFRAAERTFSLLTQVAGRAGRGSAAGRVFIQTYCPAHYAIRHASEHDVDAFYADELSRRRAPGFPPFARMIALTISGLDLAQVEKHAAAYAAEFAVARMAVGADRFRFFGPLPPSLARVKDQYRMRLLLSGPTSATLRDVFRRAEEAVAARADRAWNRHKVVIDVDPLDCG